MSATTKLTPAMLRELRSFARDGNPSDPADWEHAPESLWFHARERVITALIARGLLDKDLESYTVVTDKGRAALDKFQVIA